MRTHFQKHQHMLKAFQLQSPDSRVSCPIGRLPLQSVRHPKIALHRQKSGAAETLTSEDVVEYGYIKKQGKITKMIEYILYCENEDRG
jgi:hypothetical protein